LLSSQTLESTSAACASVGGLTPSTLVVVPRAATGDDAVLGEHSQIRPLAPRLQRNRSKQNDSSGRNRAVDRDLAIDAMYSRLSPAR
jgi:hypothetical protein